MSVTILSALQAAAIQLQNVTDVPQLETEILLAHVLSVSRTYLHTWPEKELTQEQENAFFDLIKKRESGEPIPYLTGHREFWSLDLVVNSDVLIPRPETELLVELVLQKTKQQPKVLIADLGTGSGAIALAIAHEKPESTLYAVDKSNSALNVARLNAKRLSIFNIIFQQGEWCLPLSAHFFDIIVSNPPYIPADDPHLRQGDLRFEPQSALVSPEQGLGDIHQIILQSKHCLKANGLLMLEHGYNQAKNVASIFANEGYTSIETYSDLAENERVTIAIWPGFDIDYTS